MRTASAIEWIFCRLTTKERAAAMVGDLVETENEKGKLWFWLSVSGVALSLFWRRPLAFVVALVAGSYTQYFFLMATMCRHPGYQWMPVHIVLYEVVGPLCCLSFYAAIRYGLQERTTQMELAWTTVICAVAIFFSWQPMVLALSIGAALCFVVAAMWTSKRRMESAVVLVSLAIGFAANLLTKNLAMNHSGLWISKGMVKQASHGSIALYSPKSDLSFWVMTLAPVLSLLVMTTAWSYLRDWLMRRQLLESRGEML